MKKVYIFLVIIIVIISILAYFFIRTNTCLDKGGSSIYFEKNYYLTHLSDFNNKSGLSVIIPEEETIAKYSESAFCFDKGSYFIRENGNLKKVNREKFNDFLKNYPSSSLLVQSKLFGPMRGIIEVSSDKTVCNTYPDSYKFDCVNVTG